MRISTMDSKQAKLGPNGSYQVLTSTGNGNSPRWGDSNGKTTDAAGAFTIATDNSFPFPNPCKSKRWCLLLVGSSPLKQRGGVS